MDIVPIGPGFAAEIRGVTLADVAADDTVYAAVRAAFEEHSVLLFRGQEISGEGQLAFSSRFGPPEVTKVGSIGTGTNFVILTTIGDDGNVVPEDHRYALRNKANQLWHTDSSFKAVPALTSVLSARTIPDHGGETEFASTRLAFARLDPTLQKKVENAFAWHHYGHSRAKVAPGLATTEELDALPPPLLAPSVAQSGQRPRRALHRLARLRDRRHGAGGRNQADRGTDRRRNGPRHHVSAQVEVGRRHHVG
jgi:alpha-ketoglutarate-dependent 2,4-dichlorophenoxyacetate dioxygenase